MRTIPVFGPAIGWAGAKLVPRGSRTWVQIRAGAARGIWLHLNPRTGGSYFDGGGEPEVQKALERHLRAGMIFYDVGANMGFFSLLAARIVGKDGHVFAFEADPEVATRLSENVERNAMPWIAVEKSPVDEKSGQVFFERTDPSASPDRGLGHIVEQPNEKTITLEAVSLDDFVQKNGAPDFVKCDVEGAECRVFRGAPKLLAERRPVILCEMHSEENRRFLLEEFSRFRYLCKELDENHVLALPQ
jgi:FkbM family methyltransferase